MAVRPLQSDLLELKETSQRAPNRSARRLQSDLLELKGYGVDNNTAGTYSFNRTCWN